MIERHGRSSPQAKFGGRSRAGRPWPRAANSVARRKRWREPGRSLVRGESGRARSRLRTSMFTGPLLGACEELDVVLIAEGAEFSLTGHFSDDAQLGQQLGSARTLSHCGRLNRGRRVGRLVRLRGAQDDARGDPFHHFILQPADRAGSSVSDFYQRDLG